jgi:hypothetical protein
MTDRIDPGPGWRLLEPEEIVKHGDERWVRGEWALSLNAGLRQVFGFAYRRRIAPITTKAIATRATVTLAFRDGRIVTRTERNDSGLGEKAMRETMETWGCASLIGAKYIMLEIQMEGEP